MYFTIHIYHHMFVIEQDKFKYGFDITLFVHSTFCFTEF